MYRKVLRILGLAQERLCQNKFLTQPNPLSLLLVPLARHTHASVLAL